MWAPPFEALALAALVFVLVAVIWFSLAVMS